MFDRIIVVRGDAKAKFVVPHGINYLEEYVTDYPYSTDSKFTMANNGLDVGTPYIIFENELDGDVFDLYFDVNFQNPICEETAKGRKISRTLIVYAKLAEPEE